MWPNLAGETPAEIRWRSTQNIKFLEVTSNIRIPEPSEYRGSKDSLEGRPCVSMPNIAVHPSLASVASNLGLQSVTSCKTDLLVSNTTQDTSGLPVTVVNTDVHAVRYGVRRKNSSGNFLLLWFYWHVVFRWAVCRYTF